MSTIKFIFRLIYDTYTEWSHDRAARLGAALAYYALFSIAPLMVIMIRIAGAVYGEAAARGQIVNAVSDQIGPNAALGVEQLLADVYQSGSSLLTTVLTAILLIYGATNLFSQLRDALNTIWNVRPKPYPSILGGFLEFAWDRFISSVMVIIVSIFLLAALAASASLTVLNGWLRTLVTPNTSFLLERGNIITGFGVATLLFAITFKLLPDVRISWSVVWVGAMVTSCLFNIGAFLIGIYLGYYASESALGGAESLVLIMIWIAYSAQIIFFGAKFALVYGSAIGKPIEPASYAMTVRLSPFNEQPTDSNNDH